MQGSILLIMAHLINLYLNNHREDPYLCAEDMLELNSFANRIVSIHSMRKDREEEDLQFQEKE
jgi:hypothetical protein